MPTAIRSYRDLIVWQKAMDIVSEVYALTAKFPKEELYGLASQMKDCAVSIPSNIAEGSRQGTTKSFRHFLTIAFGSGAELETQIEISKRLPFGKHLNFCNLDTLLDEVMKMLNKMISNLHQ